MRSIALLMRGNIATMAAICSADIATASGPSSAFQYLTSKSESSFSCGIFGPSQMSLVITRPPDCSSVMPFSRTVIVTIVSCASYPAICFFCPVSFTSKSISNSFVGFWASVGLPSSFPASFSASFFAFSWLSRILRRSSSKVVTV